MKYDVAIIGGGAAGLACAVRLCRSEKNLKIIIIEAADRLGKKLAATGVSPIETVWGIGYRWNGDRK